MDRQLLLSPNSSMRVERYMISMGIIEPGAVDPVLTQVCPMAFRPDNILAHALITWPVPWWLHLFGWLAVPWIVTRWDDETDERRWGIGWIHPFRRLYASRRQRAERAALSACLLESLQIGTIETLAGPGFPLGMLVAPGGLSRIEAMPTASPGITIRMRFRGTATCRFTVKLAGFSRMTVNDRDLPPFRVDGPSSPIPSR